MTKPSMTEFTHVVGCPCSKCKAEKQAGAERLTTEPPCDKYGFHDYPIPSHAAHIWCDGQNLYLGLPPRQEDGRGHVLTIPLSRCQFSYSGWGTITAGQTGWKQLLEMLLSRNEDSEARKPSAIGTAGAKTQVDLERLLVAMEGRVTKIESKKQLPRGATLKDIGL